MLLLDDERSPMEMQVPMCVGSENGTETRTHRQVRWTERAVREGVEEREREDERDEQHGARRTEPSTGRARRPRGARRADKPSTEINGVTKECGVVMRMCSSWTYIYKPTGKRKNNNRKSNI